MLKRANNSNENSVDIPERNETVSMYHLLCKWFSISAVDVYLLAII